ncbi:MAG TPA: hypothetical protein VMR96_09940, partial [Solirubrobacterales bacterium]|nr:hypothetical protein [Solirubrobacterales bacterium]
MKTSKDRRGRTDNQGFLRWLALGGALCALALGAGPSQAATGGASAVSSDETTPAGGGTTFSSPMRSAGATWYGPGL